MGSKSPISDLERNDKTRTETYTLNRNTKFGEKGARCAQSIAGVNFNETSHEPLAYLRARQAAEDNAMRGWIERWGNPQMNKMVIRFVQLTFEVLVEITVDA